MRGMAIELRNKQNTGWAQRDPIELLRMTYATADVQRALEAVSKASAGRPILLKGQRSESVRAVIPEMVRRELANSGLLADGASISNRLLAWVELV
jgi:hypothetical protein